MLFMLLLPPKLGLSLFKLENHHHHHSEALSASLRDFRSKIITHILSKPGKESESSNLAWFNRCFELMHTSSKAFEELVAEMDYPTTRWGGEATQGYLDYTLNLLNILNSISASLSHLNQAKISILHGLGLVQNSPSSAPKYLKKIGTSNLGKKDFRVEASAGIEIRPGCDKKERVTLEALIVLKKTGILAIGLVLMGLDCGTKPYLEIGNFPGGADDPLNRVLESRFCNEMEGKMEEVEEVNRAMEQALSSGTCDEAGAKELKGRLEVLENSIQGIDKEASNLFSQVIADRNKLLDSIRFMGEYT